MIAFVLHQWGAVEVRANAGEDLFLTFLGGVWLMVAKASFPWLGLNVRDDAVERKNPAALVALCGAMMAVAFTFAGGNIGEGPSSWNNVFSAAVATGGLFGLWLLLELGARVSVSIAEERDLASGVRLSGFLIALGLIFGRAAAGDWHSESATLQDFVHEGWAAVLLWVVALVVERSVRPSRQRPFPAWARCGLLPALLYLAFSVAWLWHLGAWEGMPQ